MRDGFGVGFAGEFRTLLFQHLPQFAKILDDAVVDHRDIVGRMRMRVALGRLAMRRPAGMADPGVAREWLSLQSRFQVFQFAFGAAAFEMVAFKGRDTRGIIAAIFKAFERIHDLVRDRTAPQNSDNAAHAEKYPQIAEKFSN